jgi:hypothetical protein
MNENHQIIIGLFVVGLILYLYWKYLFSPTGWFADRRSAYLQLLEKSTGNGELLDLCFQKVLVNE